jgi:hypothetical protein
MKYDVVIGQILDNLLETTGIDPAAVEPDSRLIEDLELTQGQIDLFFQAIGRDLSLSSPMEMSSVPGLSLRQLVDQVKMSMESKSKEAA